MGRRVSLANAAPPGLQLARLLQRHGAQAERHSGDSKPAASTSITLNGLALALRCLAPRAPPHRPRSHSVDITETTSERHSVVAVVLGAEREELRRAAPRRPTHRVTHHVLDLAHQSHSLRNKGNKSSRSAASPRTRPVGGGARPAAAALEGERLQADDQPKLGAWHHLGDGFTLEDAEGQEDETDMLDVHYSEAGGRAAAARRWPPSPVLQPPASTVSPKDHRRRPRKFLFLSNGASPAAAAAPAAAPLPPGFTYGPEANDPSHAADLAFDAAG